MTRQRSPHNTISQQSHNRTSSDPHLRPLHQVTFRFTSFPIEVGMPFQSQKKRLSLAQKPDWSTSGLEGTLHFLHSMTRRSGRRTTRLQQFFPKSDCLHHPGRSRTRRDTLRSFFKDNQPFSAVHRTTHLTVFRNQITPELHLLPPIKSPSSEISQSRSTYPSSHKKRLSFTQKPDWFTSHLEWWRD